VLLAPGGAPASPGKGKRAAPQAWRRGYPNSLRKQRSLGRVMVRLSREGSRAAEPRSITPPTPSEPPPLPRGGFSWCILHPAAPRVPWEGEEGRAAGVAKGLSQFAAQAALLGAREGSLEPRGVTRGRAAIGNPSVTASPCHLPLHKGGFSWCILHRSSICIAFTRSPAGCLRRYCLRQSCSSRPQLR
jgi:hypothetical protein